MKAFACILGVVLAGLVVTAPAAALVITFDDVVSVGNPLVASLDGGAFSLYDFDAAGLFAGPTGGLRNAREVRLLARQVGGGLLSLSSDLGTTASFLHFNVPASWARLESVTFTGLVSAVTPGALALDDVGVGVGASVAEPPTLLLGLTAGVGLAAMLLIRRRLH